MVESGGSKGTEVRVWEADVGTTDLCLAWIDNQQTRAIKNRLGRKQYEWRMNEVKTEQEQQDLQGETSKNAVKFPE